MATTNKSERQGGGDERRPRRCELHRLGLSAWQVGMFFIYLFFFFCIHFRQLTFPLSFINISAPAQSQPSPHLQRVHGPTAQHWHTTGIRWLCAQTMV